MIFFLAQMEYGLPDIKYLGDRLTDSRFDRIYRIKQVKLIVI